MFGVVPELDVLCYIIMCVFVDQNVIMVQFLMEKKDLSMYSLDKYSLFI